MILQEAPLPGRERADIQRALPSLEHTIVVSYTEIDDHRLSHSTSWSDWLERGKGADPPFERLPFNHPLCILFSSGTTGVPKCIVHGAGGTLIQHLKELQLHSDVRAGDRVFYFTTCGWMMWNWLVSALASDAALVLYDGSPFHPDGNVLFDYADAAGVTLFGTSAKFLDAAAKAGIAPIETHRLESVRTITSTGSDVTAGARGSCLSASQYEVVSTCRSYGGGITS